MFNSNINFMFQCKIIEIVFLINAAKVHFWFIPEPYYFLLAYFYKGLILGVFISLIDEIHLSLLLKKTNYFREVNNKVSESLSVFR